MRTFNAHLVYTAVKDITKGEPTFDCVGWIAHPLNIALTNTDGDIALFEVERPGYMSGHYHFNSRGRSAITAGKSFLDEVFNPCYNVEVIRGLTPLENLGARWMSRQLGFTSYGAVKTDLGPHEIFILHRKDHAA